MFSKATRLDYAYQIVIVRNRQIANGIEDGWDQIFSDISYGFISTPPQEIGVNKPCV